MDEFPKDLSAENIIANINNIDKQIRIKRVVIYDSIKQKGYYEATEANAVIKQKGYEANAIESTAKLQMFSILASELKSRGFYVNITENNNNVSISVHPVKILDNYNI